MPHPLDDVYAKLQRAQAHIGTVREELAVFLGDDALVANLRDNDGSDAVQAFAREHAEREVPMHLRIVAGEVIHQVRSALDHVVTVLILANGGTRHPKAGFPIELEDPKVAGTQKRFDNMIAGMSDAAKDIIVSVQPYHRREPKDHELAVLKAMNDADKHETVLLTVPGTVALNHVTWDDGFVGEALDEGDSDILRDVGLRVQRKLAANVVFPMFGTKANFPLLKGLETFWWSVYMQVYRPVFRLLRPEELDDPDGKDASVHVGWV